MEMNNLIPVENLCTHYHAAFSFFHSLNDYGLIEMTIIEEKPFINQEHIRDIERMIHLHYDLDINMEGIDAISHLLNRIEHLNEELNSVRSRLFNYESDKTSPYLPGS